MSRSGWDLSTGNIVTGAIINIALGFIGVFLLKEGLSYLNIAGVLLCIVGVILIGYKSSSGDQPSGADTHAAVSLVPPSLAPEATAKEP